MSGIVGYVGTRNAQQILLDGLDQLDYRGYDSAGILISDGERLGWRRATGRIKQLRDLLLREPLQQGTIGMGHTRWATHGAPTDNNSHPLTGCDERFFVVHNGIIENYMELKRELEKQGHQFTTETDTEVIPHLLETRDTGDLEETVRVILPLLRGSFALAIMSSEQPNTIIAVSQDNPLVIGFGRGEAFLASDIPALIPHTKEIYPIKNGEMAILSDTKVKVRGLDGEALEARPTVIEWERQDVMRNDYPHYMLKEIFEQPRVIEALLQVHLDEAEVYLPKLAEIWEKEPDFSVERIFIVGSGSSNHAGLIGKKMMDRWLGIPIDACSSSEFLDDHPPLGPGHLVILLSQSGETADTLSVLRTAKQHDCKVYAITNTRGGTIARQADQILYMKAGPELAIASTKAYTTQLTCLALLTIGLAERLKVGIDVEEMTELFAALRRLPVDVESTLIMTQDAIDQFAEVVFDQEHLFVIGRGLDYVLALEAALKLQEISYLHADAYQAGELKHGTMALITPGMPIIALATQQDVFSKMVNNIKEVKARGAFVMGITAIGDHQISEDADQVLYIPETHPWLMPILAAIPLQLLAYYSGVVRDLDVDRPRNLAKSMTVE
ncbi:glutamine--fructose-6-phosphate aminotransferase [Ammoniphilus oxalaticus]|uniref:Glutamine--fructose-6-phosphate aminotransferase [isomerizing] n=1 Tax=Ammoniphilus oxalaticus TaxID=66863 RepID=A0A419SK40_9BACL|nr:glutamine--fructose-6-phosphate transaminase (isomerizing) [Ammoniphilus oxalaticus]RKD24347.1 glutamine--fructose-6-phosphate aminotransferase [Ammoniphilus oxalaticus]